MESLPFSLAQELHYFDTSSRTPLPKTVRLDHYKTFDEAFIKLHNTALDYFIQNTAKGRNLPYYIADAAIGVAGTDQIASRLRRIPLNHGITDPSSPRYLEAIQISGGLNYMSDMLKEATIKRHNNYQNEQSVMGIYIARSMQTHRTFKAYAADIDLLNQANYSANHLFYYKSIHHQPVAGTNADTGRLAAVEQYYHGSSINEITGWMLHALFGKPGSELRLSSDIFPKLNRLVIEATHDTIADVIIQEKNSRVLDKGLYLSFRYDAAYVEAAYEMPLLKNLKQERPGTTCKMASIGEDGDLIIPAPEILALKDLLVTVGTAELQNRIKTTREPPSKDKGNKMKK